MAFKQSLLLPRIVRLPKLCGIRSERLLMIASYNHS
jgi:hypothetical protein